MQGALLKGSLFIYNKVLNQCVMVEAIFGIFAVLFIGLFANVWRIHDTLQDILRELKDKSSYKDQKL